jgi:predicted solute-binding protein
VTEMVLHYYQNSCNYEVSKKDFIFLQSLNK